MMRGNGFFALGFPLLSPTAEVGQYGGFQVAVVSTTATKSRQRDFHTNQ